MSTGVRFVVRVTPRSGAARVDGVNDDGQLRLRVTSPPAEGAANDAVIRLLAAELGVAKSDVAIQRGQAARVKLVYVSGVSNADLLTRWPRLRVTGERGGENEPSTR